MINARQAKISWLLVLAACTYGLMTMASDVDGRQENTAGFPNISYQAKTATGLTITVIPASKHDLSPPLRELVKIPSALNLESGETEVENRVLPKYSLAKGTEALGERDAALQEWRGPEAMPNPIHNWEGLNNLDGVLPPDPTGAVGPSHFVQWVNLHMAIWDRSGTLIGVPFPGNTIWSGFGGPCDSCNDGDPVVLYDRLAGRWVISQFALTGGPPYYQYVAVSQTSDPTGQWYRYAFTWPNNKMNDYPKLGVWPDGYYMTANQFIGNTWAGAGVAVMDRAKMLLGDSSATIQYIDLYSVDPNFGGMLPCDVDGPAPPAGAPAYFGEVDDSTSIGPSDAFRIWQFHVDWATPASSTFGISGQPNQILPVTPFTPICTSTRNCIPQPGTSRGLDAIGDRLMFRLQYRNFGTYQTLVTNHTVDAGSGNAGVRWYEMRNSGSGWNIYQQGTYAPDSDNRWMGSAAMNSSGAIAVGYSVSSSTTYPSIRYAGRLSTDPLGALSQGETTLIAGSGSQTSSYYRWGDYSTLSLDPIDDCTFWYTQEYMATTSSAGWQTRIGAFQIPCCVTPSVPAIVAASVPGNNQITVTWTAGATPGATYNVYRATLADGTVNCTTGLYMPLASGVGALTFTDNTVVGGVTYGYRVTAVDNTAGCESAQSGCVKATATGSCLTPPTFGGLTSVTPVTGTTCSLQLAWTGGTSNCGGTITYNVYRNAGSAPVPPAGLIQSGLTGTTYTDASLTSGTTYYYIVQAVDSANGMSDGNTTAKSGTPGAPSTTTLFSDNFESGSGLNGWGKGYFSSTDTTANWRGIQACAPTHSGNNIFRFGGTTCTSNYSNNVYSFVEPNGTSGLAFPAGATSCRLSFWHRWKFETGYDGALLYLSTDGTNYTVIPASAMTSGSYNGAIGSISVWTGSFNGSFTNTIVDLDAAYNTINGTTTGLAGKKAYIAFCAYTDGSTKDLGWYLDDVVVTYDVGGTCTSCAAPSSLANNTAADINPCAASGVQVTWSLDPGNWGDVSGTRTYDVLRDGSPVQTGIAYGTTSMPTTPPDSASHSYTVRYNNACGLSAATIGASAADQNNPANPTISGASTNPCPATSVTLTTEVGMNAYQWYLDGGAIGGATSNTCSASASGTYTVSYTNGSGCSGTSTGHLVTITPVPSTPTATNSGPICAGSALYLFASAVPGATYGWTGPNGFISSIQNPSIPNATIAAAGLYSVTASVGGCASAAGTTTVTVNPTSASPTFVSALPVPDIIGASAQQVLTLTTPIGSSMPSSFALTWDSNFAFSPSPSHTYPLGFWQEMRPYATPFVPTAFYPILWSDTPSPGTFFADVNGNGTFDPATDYLVTLSGKTVTVSRTVSSGAPETQAVGYRLVLQSGLITNPGLVGDYPVTAVLSLACGGWSGSLNETITTSPSGCPLNDVGNWVRLTKSGTNGEIFTISWANTVPSACLVGYGVFTSTDCRHWEYYGPFATVDQTQTALPPAGTGVNVTYFLVTEIGSDGLMGPLGHYGM